MLSVQQLKFVNLVLESMLGKGVEDYSGLHEMECSALIEVGNIMISTFINALSSLAGIDIELTVPAFTVDMQGPLWRCLWQNMGTVGLYHDYRRQFCPRWTNSSLQAAVVS